MATSTKKYKEIQVNKETYFIEQYANAGGVYLWRYGYIAHTLGERFPILLRDNLRTRPNIAKIFG